MNLPSRRGLGEDSVTKTRSKGTEDSKKGQGGRNCVQQRQKIKREEELKDKHS